MGIYCAFYVLRLQCLLVAEKIWKYFPGGFARSAKLVFNTVLPARQYQDSLAAPDTAESGILKC